MQHKILCGVCGYEFMYVFVKVRCWHWVFPQSLFTFMFWNMIFHWPWNSIWLNWLAMNFGDLPSLTCKKISICVSAFQLYFTWIKDILKPEMKLKADSWHQPTHPSGKTLKLLLLILASCSQLSLWLPTAPSSAGCSQGTVCASQKAYMPVE